MDLQVLPIKSLNDKEKIEVDRFIMEYSNNGEFINTLKYLSYHPKDRFMDDSIIVKDVDSGNIKGVIMAASKKDEKKKIISHPGTTFAGLILNRKNKIVEIEKIVDLVISYYSQSYNHIELKLSPILYSSQPNQLLEYILFHKGFQYSFNALANIINLAKIKEERDIINLYSSKRRNQVKKVINEEKYIFNKNNKIDLCIWNNMNKNIEGKFSSQTTHSYDEITILKEKFPLNIIPYTTYRNDDKYGAFALVYIYKNVFHTQYLDMNYELRQDYPNLYLIHELIKVAYKEGFKYFSFGASTEKAGKFLNEGLFHYKFEFGGGEILLPVYKKELS